MLLFEAGYGYESVAVISRDNATALEASELLIVKRKDLIPFLEERPDICLRFMETLCERLRRSEALIQDAVFLNTSPRLARQLL